MKNSFLRKLTLIMIFAVIAVGGSIFATAYSLSYRALVNDIRVRTESVSERIASDITLEDIRAAGGENNETVNSKLERIKAQTQQYISMNRLYIARPGEDGRITTSLPPEEPQPEGALLYELIQSIQRKELVTSSSIHGSIFGAYWPVLNVNGDIEGIVCMEYTADGIAIAYRDMMIYSIAISAGFIVFTIITARLLIGKTSDDFYKKLAYTDILTGYENRMAFEIRLKKAEIEAKEGKPTAIMVFDLNNLKKVNDALGHKEGDTLIKNTADVIAQHLNQPGCLYRTGGDEFAAILTGYDWKSLQNIITAIHTEKKEVLKNYPFSCAAGMSRYDRTGDKSLRDAYQRADDSMYENKRRTKSKALKVDEREKGNIELLREAARNR